MTDDEDPELRKRLQDQAIAVLKSFQGRRAELDESEYLFIKNARNEDVTWKEIAEALGLESAQGAEQRYARLDTRVYPVPPQPCQVCGGSCGIVCDKEAQQRADAEFDCRVAAAINRLDIQADSAGYVHAYVPVNNPKPPEPEPELRIRGLAGRAARFGPDLIVPPSVPLLIEFSDTDVVCAAGLTRDDEGIHATAVIPLLPGSRLAMTHAKPGGIARLWPRLALAVAYAVAQEKDGIEMITGGRVASVSLCANGDPDVPDWEVVS